MQRKLFATAAFVWLAMTAGQAGATITTFQALIEYNGGVPPVGSPPWLTVEFDDGGTSGLVTMTLTATNLTANEFVSGLYLNLDPTLDPTGLVFSPPTEGDFESPTISLGTNLYKADGDGHFDILLAFSESDGLPNRFTAGDAVSYDITGFTDLTAGSFNFVSAPDGAGAGLYPMAAHVQATGQDGSGSAWVSAPEPASLALLLVGGLTLMRRRG